ncbi:MAG: hypothetical protein HC836_34620 [Richelia sp. RM2_1_2]|nr:hypothetical protein [Richelia sp. RM2_1_2]
MKTFKTVSEFKKILATGDKLHAVHHMEFDGRDEQQKPIWKDKDLGIRVVTIKQTNSFALATTKKDGSICDSWCGYPKASEAKVENNKLTIFEKDMRKFPGGLVADGNPDYDNLPLIPLLTYSFAD